MASGLKSKLARVSRMEWEELRVRAKQEFHKRADLFKYTMRTGNGQVQLAPGSTRSGQFFFPPDAGRGRAELLQKYLPAEAAEILREADEICGRRFHLLGYENLNFAVGDSKEREKEKEIDWHLDPVHGKRAPLAPWFKIPFLDFEAVGDHKVTWELNRHQHLVTLAKARLLSGNEKYTRELAAQWHSWIRANPYPLGINWGSTLEVAFRSLSWIWVDQLLAGIADCAGFRAELIPALAFHGRYIERYLSTYFSPNTHLLGEAVALFFLGTLYSEMPQAARWKETGWNILLTEADRQVRPDGVYFEQSLYYHVYALDFFLHARLLAERNFCANDAQIPPRFDAVLQRMLDVVATLAQAGPAESFGDDDGGRLWNPRRNRTEHMTDPLALGAAIFSKRFSAAAPGLSERLTEEAIWLLGEAAVNKLSGSGQSATSDSDLRSFAFPDGGIFVLADSRPHRQQLVVDAGPQGVGRSGHGHADALSVRFTMDGRRWLVDSGSGVYISKDPADRNKLRGTGAHNTMRVDGMDQAIPDQPFSWTQIPAVKAEDWVVGNAFTYFVGSHNGYTRLADPVLHRRHVMNVAGGVFLVRDLAIGHAEHELDINWHFAPDLEVRAVGPRRLEVSAPDRGSALNVIVPDMAPDTEWQMEAGTMPISPSYGELQSAPAARCHTRITLPAETATAFASFTKATKTKGSDSEQSGFEPRLVSRALAAVQAYELDCHNERHEFFFALGENAWNSGPLSSDARVLYRHIEKGEWSRLIVVGGTYVHWEGRPLMESKASSRFFEWDRKNFSMDRVPEHVSISPLFEELVTGSGASAPSDDTSTNLDLSKFAEKR